MPSHQQRIDAHRSEHDLQEWIILVDGVPVGTARLPPAEWHDEDARQRAIEQWRARVTDARLTAAPQQEPR